MGIAFMTSGFILCYVETFYLQFRTIAIALAGRVYDLEFQSSEEEQICNYF